jgi:hypothetical protein
MQNVKETLVSTAHAPYTHVSALGEKLPRMPWSTKPEIVWTQRDKPPFMQSAYLCCNFLRWQKTVKELGAIR